MFRVLFALAVILASSGCAIRNTRPVDSLANVIQSRPVDRIRTFVDANGTFYPDGWDAPAVVGREALDERHTILNALWLEQFSARRDALRRYESGWLDRVEETLQDKRRVFILVHGFNDPEPSVASAYWMVENNLDLKPDDAVVEFFWDGLDAGGTMPGAGRIWFWAAGYSQVAGSRGLRRILDRISDADIYLISHSRGASVALSALANPPYAHSFETQTNALCFLTDEPPPMSRCTRDFLRPARLQNESNRIHLLMLAPAIGHPDFWARSGGPELRDFATETGGQFVDIRHTTNPDDPVLKKYLRGLSNNFNATDLGYDGRVSETLRARGYPLIPYPISNLPHHDFPLYVRCDVVIRMFQDAGIGRREPRQTDGSRC